MTHAAALLFAAAMAAAAPLRFEGTVRDATGAPVANAAVSIEAGGDSARVSTDAEGRFSVEWPGPKLVIVTVEAVESPFALSTPSTSVSGPSWRWCSGSRSP